MVDRFGLSDTSDRAGSREHTRASSCTRSVLHGRRAGVEVLEAARAGRAGGADQARTRSATTGVRAVPLSSCFRAVAAEARSGCSAPCCRSHRRHLAARRRHRHHEHHARVASPSGRARSASAGAHRRAAASICCSSWWRRSLVATRRHARHRARRPACRRCASWPTS